MTLRSKPLARPGASAPASEAILSLSPWWDPDLAVRGHDPVGEYTEIHWLPVLGPSALLALRWTARQLKANPQGFEVRHRDFARAIGLGTKPASDSPAVRCLDRLCHFGLARPDAQTATRRALQVRTHVPAVPEHLRRRLPQNLRKSARP